MKRTQKQTRGAVVGEVHDVKLLELLHGLLPVTMEGGMDQNENMIQF